MGAPVDEDDWFRIVSAASAANPASATELIRFQRDWKQVIDDVVVRLPNEGNDIELHVRDHDGSSQELRGFDGIDSRGVIRPDASFDDPWAVVEDRKISVLELVASATGTVRAKMRAWERRA